MSRIYIESQEIVIKARQKIYELIEIANEPYLINRFPTVTQRDH